MFVLGLLSWFYEENLKAEQNGSCAPPPHPPTPGVIKEAPFIRLLSGCLVLLSLFYCVGFNSWRYRKHPCFIVFSAETLSLAWEIFLYSWIMKIQSPYGLTFTWWGCYGLCLWHKPTELPHSFLFCSCVCFCLYVPFNCISSINSPDNFLLSHSVLLVLFLPYWSFQLYLFVKVSLSPDVILHGWLGLKHQLAK